MIISVRCHFVPRGVDVAHHARIFLRHRPEHEECRLYPRIVTKPQKSIYQRLQICKTVRVTCGINPFVIDVVPLLNVEGEKVVWTVRRPRLGCDLNRGRRQVPGLLSAIENSLRGMFSMAGVLQRQLILLVRCQPFAIPADKIKRIDVSISHQMAFFRTVVPGNRPAASEDRSVGAHAANVHRKVVLLIPAYRPSSSLLHVVGGVLAGDRVHAITAVVVVDDGSGPEFRDLFDSLERWEQVRVLRHARNLGKGAALKTGFNYALVTFPDAAGIVTADADGQHSVPDILNVACIFRQDPEQIVLGVRKFASEVPLRSRLGNILTRIVFRLFTGVSLADTQTGLRAWPRRYCMDSLLVRMNGYDFELECLLKVQESNSDRSFAIRQVPIDTIYLDGNRASHFNPLRDSMRIYFVFVRACGASMLTACIDSLMFSLAFSATGNLAASMIVGRAVAIVVAFFMARNLVFRSSSSVMKSFGKYIAAAIVMGTVSFNLLKFFHASLGFPVLPAKLTAEGLLFLVSFSIQRQIIFGRPGNGEA